MYNIATHPHSKRCSFALYATDMQADVHLPHLSRQAHDITCPTCPDKHMTSHALLVRTST